jgi:hypothetical protein
METPEGSACTTSGKNNDAARRRSAGRVDPFLLQRLQVEN